VSVVLTIGYGGRSLDELVKLLEERGVKVVVDVRHDARSAKPEFSARSLERSLSAHGIDYVRLSELGVPKAVREPYVRGELPFERFRQWYLQWIEGSREKWEPKLREAGRKGPVALLCAERYPKPHGTQKHHCHRDVLADHLIGLGLFEKRVDVV